MAFQLFVKLTCRFETGSLMDLSYSQKNFSIRTDFYLHLPNEDHHNVSVYLCLSVYMTYVYPH